MKLISKTPILVFVAFLILAFNLGCAAQTLDTEKILSQLDNGKVVGNRYENKLLGLRITFPKTMSVDEKTVVESDLRDGIAMLKEGKAVDQKLVAEMIRKDRIVFTLDLPESGGSIGAALSLTIKKDETGEQLSPMVERTIKFFTDSGKQKLKTPSKNESFGKLDFITFSLSMDVEGGTVFSKIYSSKRNGYLLTFSISYADEKGLIEMEKVLKTIESF